MRTCLLALLLVLVMTGMSPVVEAQDEPIYLRMLNFEEGTSIDVMTGLLADFEAENPAIRVEIDLINYAEISEILETQIAAGIAPDLARLTELGRFSAHYLDLRPYLSDPAAWDSNFAEPLLAAMRADPSSDALHGYPTDFTISGPYINRSLFAEAGVPVPSDNQTEVTWEQWIDAAVQVQTVLSTPDAPVYALAMDRSGHRFWGPSLSLCATYLDEAGAVTVDTPGFRTAAEMLYNWHVREITPLDVWAGVGDQYRAPADMFIAGETAFYFSGSWMVGEIGTGVGDRFEWEVVPNPTGPCGSTGMVGGGVMAAFRYTEHPEAVGRLMSFLTREDNLEHFYRESFFLPGSASLIDQGIEYSRHAAALNTFAAEIPEVMPEAYQLQYHPESGPIHSVIRVRLSQVMSGELTLEEAIPLMQREIDAITGSGL